METVIKVNKVNKSEQWKKDMLSLLLALDIFHTLLFIYLFIYFQIHE